MNPQTTMTVVLNPSLPASAGTPLSYLVGQDGEGHWVAVETAGRAGGIFRSRKDAICYACVETGCRPDAVKLATGPIPFRLV